MSLGAAPGSPLRVLRPAHAFPTDFVLGMIKVLLIRNKQTLYIADRNDGDGREAEGQWTE
jgi:hypothetical protein